LTFEKRLWQGNATVKLDGCFLSGLFTSGQQSQFTNFCRVSVSQVHGRH